VVIVLLSFGILYALFSVYLIVGWKKINEPILNQLSKPVTSVAIIVPIRNEKDTIELLLQDLKNQAYPQELLTVYLADDGSLDGTDIIINNWINRYPNYFKPVSLLAEYAGWKGKKKMIASAIAISDATLILTTDADCRIPVGWVRSMVDSYEHSHAAFISGPVIMKGKPGYWNSFQSIEFSSLVGSGASAIGLHLPVMCNGANVAYTRSAYEKVKGFEGNENIASGDDEFLMHKITSQFSANSVIFCKNKEAIVVTAPAASWGEFYNQRKRWAGKWEHYKLWYVQVIAVWVFLFHFFLLLSSILGILGVINPELPLIMWVIKAFFDYLYLKSIARFLSIDFKNSTFINAVMIYPFYAVGFGIAARFGSYTWKERTEDLS